MGKTIPASKEFVVRLKQGNEWVFHRYLVHNKHWINNSYIIILVLHNEIFLELRITLILLHMTTYSMNKSILWHHHNRDLGSFHWRMVVSCLFQWCFLKNRKDTQISRLNAWVLKHCDIDTDFQILKQDIIYINAIGQS